MIIERYVNELCIYCNVIDRKCNKYRANNNVFCVISAPTLISAPFLDLLVLTCCLKYVKEREFFVTFFAFHQNIFEKPAKKVIKPSKELLTNYQRCTVRLVQK